jgi:anti-anti-sigma factor
MAELTIETREHGDVGGLVLTGEFDLAAIEHFETALAKLEATAPKTIVVDLSGLAFMDSSGLRALVMANHRAERAGRRLAIVPGPAPVRRVFEITQLDRELDLIEDASAL